LTFVVNQPLITLNSTMLCVTVASAWSAVVGQSQGHDISRRCSDRSFQSVRRGTCLLFLLSRKFRVSVTESVKTRSSLITLCLC